MFLDKLKQIKIHFDREVSDINKNVAKVPVTCKKLFLNYNSSIFVPKSFKNKF